MVRNFESSGQKQPPLLILHIAALGIVFMKKESKLLIIGWSALIVAIGILLLLIFAENLQVQSITTDRVYYVCLLLMGLFSAISLFGFIKSQATVTGEAYGFAIELGGPAALAALVVLGGFFLIPNEKDFDVTIRVVDKNGHAVFDERKSSVTLLLTSTGARSADFTQNGEATIKGLPYRLFGEETRMHVDMYYYKQLNSDQKIKLNSNIIEITVELDPTGNPDSILNSERAHLEVLKLLIPYRIISGTDGGMEIDIDQYYSPEFRTKVMNLNFDRSITLTDNEKYDIFDVLYERSPDSVSIKSKTIAELIHESAISFRRNVAIFSAVDSEGLDPKIQRELIRISKAQFVIVAAGERPGSSETTYINEAFWDSLAFEAKTIDENNHINLFTEFSDF